MRCTLLFVFSFVSLLLSCSQVRSAADEVAPVAIPNPLVTLGVPLCAEGLTTEQREMLDVGIAAWNRAFPTGRLGYVTQCIPGLPRIIVDPGLEGHTGYTAPELEGITIRLHPNATQCTWKHELGHYLGLVRHAAPSEEPGAFSDGARGACLPTAADVAILTRAYGGKVSW